MSLETLKTKVGKLIEKAQSVGGDTFKNLIQEYIYNNCKGAGAYDAVFVFRNTSVKDVSMFDFSAVQNMSNAFASTKIEEIELDATNFINMNSTFRLCRDLKRVVIKNMNSKTTSVTGMCAFCTSLESIEGLDFSGCTSKIDIGSGDGIVFRDCSLLKEVRIVENSIKVSINFGFCPLLSAESIQNIIDGLATVETAKTLTLHANVKTKLTQTQLDTITGKNWNLA